jgi:hypothetical protein
MLYIQWGIAEAGTLAFYCAYLLPSEATWGVGEEDIAVEEEGETLGESTRIQACKCPDLKKL